MENYSVCEMKEIDAKQIVAYFHNSSVEFLEGMGVLKQKLPNSEMWKNKIIQQQHNPAGKKKTHYVIWYLDNRAIGHSNISDIIVGDMAHMHLHIWYPEFRGHGYAEFFLIQTLPIYFKLFRLNSIVCEPYAKNFKVNKALEKFGFEFVKSYEKTPGAICFKQEVNCWKLTQERFNNLRTQPHH